MSTHTLQTHEEFGPLGELAVTITFDFTPGVEETHTDPGSDPEVEITEAHIYCDGAKWVLSVEGAGLIADDYTLIEYASNAVVEVEEVRADEAYDRMIDDRLTEQSDG